jgi:hypothetical protein
MRSMENDSIFRNFIKADLTLSYTSSYICSYNVRLLAIQTPDLSGSRRKVY